MINCSGYKIEVEGPGTYFKAEAKNFDGIKKIICDSRLHSNANISVVRRRDNFEIFVGDVQRARCQFGL